MQQEMHLDDLPPELAEAIGETNSIAVAYLRGLAFIVHDTSRDPQYIPNHLLSCLSQDLLQSAVSISALVREGLLSVARRELRFLVEASVKIASVQQGSYVSMISEKLELFDKELRSPSISIKKQIQLALLAEPDRVDFDEEVGRIYGITSNYVHLSPKQIEQSIAAATSRVTAGKERPEDVYEFNRLAERAMAASLVFLFHSVPSWVAGDWLVERDGSSIEWHFIQSRFVAGMDQAFDYKHERQMRLVEIQAKRAANVKF